ncbi:MAG: hypothetical protein GAK37_03080 [Pseudomonas sp.]|nr:MAG: hypothetical protein GAK37_03080 [Pseudomonas sp.]
MSGTSITFTDIWRRRFTSPLMRCSAAQGRVIITWLTCSERISFSRSRVLPSNGRLLNSLGMRSVRSSMNPIRPERMSPLRCRWSATCTAVSVKPRITVRCKYLPFFIRLRYRRNITTRSTPKNARLATYQNTRLRGLNCGNIARIWYMNSKMQNAADHATSIARKRRRLLNSSSE